MLLVAHKTGGRIRWNDAAGTVPNILSLMPPRERDHPNEKPLDLMKRVVGIHSLPGDLVLDPFMGSATTGVACAAMGRRFIGVEFDAGHFATACRRIDAAYAQPDMFVQPPAPKPEQLSLVDALTSEAAE